MKSIYNIPEIEIRTFMRESIAVSGETPNTDTVAVQSVRSQMVKLADELNIDNVKEYYMWE